MRIIKRNKKSKNLKVSMDYLSLIDHDEPDETEESKTQYAINDDRSQSITESLLESNTITQKISEPSLFESIQIKDLDLTIYKGEFV